MSEHRDKMQSSPAWRFRMLHAAHRAATDASLSRFGVREFGQPFILFMLERGVDGSAAAQRQLSEKLRVSPATMTASLKALEKQGCIRRAPDESDQRRKRIEITEKGRQVAAKCRCAFERVDEAMYEGFTEGEIAELSAFFERMTANLRGIYAGEEDCT